MSYEPLSEKERYEIAILTKQQYSIRRIAEEIGCSHTTVSRELGRNGRNGGRAAQARSEERRSAASRRARTMTPEITARIDHLLE